MLKEKLILFYILEQNNNCVTCNKYKANVFNTFFIANLNLDTSNANLPDFSYLTEHRFEDIVATEKAVSDLITFLNEPRLLDIME